MQLIRNKQALLSPADRAIATLTAHYQDTRAPIQVNFRELVSKQDLAPKATHNLHPYPGRLLRHIPRLFLSSSILSNQGDTVLDPFCGSGTSCLEAILAGRNAIGADSNPLARLITRVKTTPVPPGGIRRASESLKRRIPDKTTWPASDILNFDYWHYPHIRRDLGRLLDAISGTRSEQYRDIFHAVLSRCIRDLSLADPRIPVPVRLNPARLDGTSKRGAHKRLQWLRNVRVLPYFFEKLEVAAQAITELSRTNLLGQFLGCFADARTLDPLSANSVTLAITSPPYLGAQKYIRASSLSLTWLGIVPKDGLRQVEDLNIGREHFHKDAYESSTPVRINGVDSLLSAVREQNPLRAHIAAVYLIEVRQSLRELHRVVKPGGHVVIVSADNRICGDEFYTTTYIREIMQELGFNLKLELIDRIRGWGLLTQRHPTSAKIEFEHIGLYRKEK